MALICLINEGVGAGWMQVNVSPPEIVREDICFNLLVHDSDVICISPEMK
jgi:hypothetical protein